MSDLHVLAVASEVYPMLKTGGLADVVAALPAALEREGIATRTLVPGYPSVVGSLRENEVAHTFASMHGGPARLLASRTSGLELLVLDAPHLYARPGNPYLDPDGNEWPDNALRFAALAAAAAAIGRGIIPTFRPDIVHAHDWQAALAPAYLHYGGSPRPRTVMTVHNLAFQGLYPAALLVQLGLPAHAYTLDGVEYHGSIGFLKAGLALADRITTVSPTYAAEIQTPEHGMGLDGLLRHRSGVLTGIRNGIDTVVWNPATDPHLRSRFDARHRTRRGINKQALRHRMSLDMDETAPLFGVVSRLAWQKGLDLLLGIADRLVAAGAQLALIGSGERELESGFIAAGERHPGRIGVAIGYDEGLAHLAQAGANAILIPSRFEPCGLTQLCAMRYGALPIVARVGGLADTVIDINDVNRGAEFGTGMQFTPVTGDALTAAIERAMALWRDPAAWRRVQAHAMAADVSWREPAAQYAALYRALAAERMP
ncbi:MAG: glycogen synthase GlgA [Steroidobacterales bacterium]